MKLSTLSWAMGAFISCVIFTFSSYGQNYDCEYTLQFEAQPGHLAEIKNGLKQKLNACGGVSPCATKRLQRFSVDMNSPSIKHEMGESNMKRCQQMAMKDCSLKQASIFRAKTVSVKFKGRALDSYVCRDQLAMQTIPAGKMSNIAASPGSSSSASRVPASRIRGKR